LPGTHPVPLLYQRHYHQYQITDASLCRRRLDHFRPILSVSDHHILPNDLHTLEQWANTWDMRFNPCKCYILSMKRAGVKSAIFYRLCGQVLESVTNNPYLGVISTDDFSFSTHVRQVGYVPRPVEHWSSSVATSETVLKNCENLHTPAYADLF